MLPGSSPCELRLLLPDTNIGRNGFHDVVVENLIGSSTWRSRHVSPSDVIALRRRWPKAVFQVMKEHGDKHILDYNGHIDTPIRAIARSENQDRWFTGVAYDVLPSRLGPALALPSRVVCNVERFRQCRDHFNDKHSGSATLD